MKPFADEFALPNEVRISMKGVFESQCKHILMILRSGYPNCKVVGRGRASEKTYAILEYLQKAAPQYSYHWSETKSLNRVGQVVDEVHLMIIQEESKVMDRSRGQFEGIKYESSRNIGQFAGYTAAPGGPGQNHGNFYNSVKTCKNFTLILD